MTKPSNLFLHPDPYLHPIVSSLCRPRIRLHAPLHTLHRGNFTFCLSSAFPERTPEWKEERENWGIRDPIYNLSVTQPLLQTVSLTITVFVALVLTVNSTLALRTRRLKRAVNTPSILWANTRERSPLLPRNIGSIIFIRNLPFIFQPLNGF